MTNDKKIVTHAITTPNKRPPAPIEQFRANLEGQFTKNVMGYFVGNEMEVMRFKTAVVDYVRKTPKLLECEMISLMSAFSQVAQFKFLPSGVSGEAYIIPYGKEAKFQLGYQGIITLLHRTGKISGITSNIIYKNDEFDYEEGLNARLVHKPAMFGKAKGEPIGVYTIVEMRDGSKTFKVMDEAQIKEIKNLSKAKNAESSPWNSDKDPFLWMWKKTCLIQHQKLLPKTEDLQQAIEKDYEGEGFDKGRLDADGPATKKVAHDGPKYVKNEHVDAEASDDVESSDGSVKDPPIG